MEKVKIGVISDTHHDLTEVEVALKRMGQLDLLLHCGDHYQDALRLEKQYRIKTLAVRGNCDNALGPEEEVFTVNSHNIFLTHGHKYMVKSGLNSLYYRCKELKIDIAIYGHTHIPSYSIEDGIHFLNPGSISLPRGGSTPSFALINVGSEVNITLQQIVK